MSEQETARATGSTALSGMKEICGYVGKSKNTVIKYIRKEGLPACKIGGEWFSDKTRVDQWRLKRIDVSLEKNIKQCTPKLED